MLHKAFLLMFVFANFSPPNKLTLDKIISIVHSVANLDWPLRKSCLLLRCPRTKVLYWMDNSVPFLMAIWARISNPRIEPESLWRHRQLLRQELESRAIWGNKHRNLKSNLRPIHFRVRLSRFLATQQSVLRSFSSQLTVSVSLSSFFNYKFFPIFLANCAAGFNSFLVKCLLEFALW